jgi:hypothetical protein
VKTLSKRTDAESEVEDEPLDEVADLGSSRANVHNEDQHRGRWNGEEIDDSQSEDDHDRAADRMRRSRHSVNRSPENSHNELCLSCSHLLVQQLHPSLLKASTPRSSSASRRTVLSALDQRDNHEPDSHRSRSASIQRREVFVPGTPPRAQSSPPSRRVSVTSAARHPPATPSVRRNLAASSTGSTLPTPSARNDRISGKKRTLSSSASSKTNR